MRSTATPREVHAAGVGSCRARMASTGVPGRAASRSERTASISAVAVAGQATTSDTGSSRSARLARAVTEAFRSPPEPLALDALVVRLAEGLLDLARGADGVGAPAIRAGDDRIIHMQGHDTFKSAVLRMSEATLEATGRAGLQLDDIGLFVYHQANARILAAVGQKLGLDDAKVVNSIDRYGNTSSATLPIALADARERGLLQPGVNVLQLNLALDGKRG